MEAPQQTETAPPTPEQLLKLLDLQLERERHKRARRGRSRASILVLGILLIIAGAGVALMVAGQLLEDLRDRGAMAPAPAETNPGR